MLSDITDASTNACKKHKLLVLTDCYSKQTDHSAVEQNKEEFSTTS